MNRTFFLWLSSILSAYVGHADDPEKWISWSDSLISVKIPAGYTIASTSKVCGENGGKEIEYFILDRNCKRVVVSIEVARLEEMGEPLLAGGESNRKESWEDGTKLVSQEFDDERLVFTASNAVSAAGGSVKLGNRKRLRLARRILESVRPVASSPTQSSPGNPVSPVK